MSPEAMFYRVSISTFIARDLSNFGFTTPVFALHVYSGVSRRSLREERIGLHSRFPAPSLLTLVQHAVLD